MAEPSDTKNGERSERPIPWPFTTMWTSLDVRNFVEDAGFPEYAHCFMNNMINGRDLKDVTAYDLQRMGVDKMVDAIRIHALLKRVVEMVHYNYDNPDQSPNVSYTANRAKMDASFLPPAKPAFMQPAKLSDIRLPYRDQGSLYKRYHLTLPTIHHQRSICSRKMHDTAGEITLHLDK